MSTNMNITTAEQVRKYFPILQHLVTNNKPLIYLDNAATSQKPQVVIDTLREFYQYQNANVHRGLHYLSEHATNAYDAARSKIQQFINAASPNECVFTRGTTESINLVAFSFGEKYISAGDEIIISRMEHHSNIVPWQLLCQRKQAILKVIPVTASGELDLSTFDQLISAKTKLIAINHVSNSIGTINPVKKIIAQAHKHGIPVLVDGAQAPAHLRIDVQDLDCDFYALSGHKMYAPMGIGLLYGKQKWLTELPPYHGGGDMILQVSLEHGTIFNSPPLKYEAGTTNVAGAIGLGAAVDFLNSLDLAALWQHEEQILHYATEKLTAIPGVTIIGNAKHKVSVVSFTIDGIHPHDIGTILDQHGIAIRAGHHCTMPLMAFYQISGTARASFGIYNTSAEVDKLAEGIMQVKAVFKKK